MFSYTGRDGSPATSVIVSSRAVEQDLKGYYSIRCRRDTILQYLDNKSSTYRLGDNRYDVCSLNKDTIKYPISLPDTSPKSTRITSVFGTIGITIP
jgi:hypothetical protein